MILGIIPARAGSKGIPKKNLYELNGNPLIYYTIEAAMESNLDEFIISTDDEEIIKLYGGSMRPDHLAADDTPMLPVIKHCIEEYEEINGRVDAICLLQPTSPLRTKDHINEALELFKGESSLYSGYKMGIKTRDKVYDKHKVGPHFQRNGAIFICTRELIFQDKLWDEFVVEYEMPKSVSVDIDDMDDMYVAGCILENRRAYESNSYWTW